jgi:hypothetical protein
MGTMPNLSDIRMLDGIMELKEGAQYSGSMDSITEKTLKKFGEIFSDQEVQNIIPTMSPTMADFDQVIGNLTLTDENTWPTQIPTYNPAQMFGR